jgi:thioredoxin-dependent peroxiredoxin
MTVAVGDRVRDVSGTTHDGRSVQLSELAAEGPLVVSFYPKAFTPGCTAQTCHLRDVSAEFAELGATVVGVSRDDADTQARFAAEYRLDFPLLADTDGQIAEALGARRPGPLPSKRQTVVLDTDLTVLGSFRSETDMHAHADQALELLRSHRA